MEELQETSMWIDQYEQLVLSASGNEKKNLLKGIDLKYENMPDLFYKYRKIENNTLDALKNEYLYFSSISKLNDPLECKIYVSPQHLEKMFFEHIFPKLKHAFKPSFAFDEKDFESEQVLISKILQGMIIPKYRTIVETKNFIQSMVCETSRLFHEKAIELCTDLLRVGIEAHRICSFSEVNDSTLMWSHYADNHKGFCVAYNIKELKNDLTELMLPVIYSQTPYEISKDLLEKYNRSIVLRAITRKSKNWDYEKEWRIVINAASNELIQKQKVPLPKKIYLGLRIENSHREELIEIAQRKGIEVFQLKQQAGEYNLTIEKVL